MLTLLETTEAIQTLNTESDIIAGACRKILGQDKEAPQEPHDILIEILDTYLDKVPPKHLCIAGALLAGRVAGAMVNPGAEIEVTKNLSELIFNEILEVSHIRLNRLAKTDPNTAVQNLITQLQQVIKK